MEYERGAKNLPVDTNMSTGSPNAAATHIAREDCPHLADPEWEALQRLSTVIECLAASTRTECARYDNSFLKWGGYPVLQKPNKHADMTNISAVPTRARTARSPVNESTVSTPGVDTLNTNNQHTQAGPVVNKDTELNTEFSSNAVDFVQHRQAVIRFVQDATAASTDRQKLTTNNNGKGNTNEFKVGILVLLATEILAKHAVSGFGVSKLAPRFFRPFTVLAKHGNAYTLDIPSSMPILQTFCVGRLKPYSQHESPSLGDSAPTPSRARRRASARHPASTQGRPARSKQSARPARAGHSTRPAPASTQRAQRSGGVQQPPDDQRGLVDQTRGVFPPPPPPLRDTQVETRWIVQRIVDRRIRTQGPDHFRIRWLGFLLSHDTWEPRNVLMRDIPVMVTEYEAHHQSRRRT
ncbi:unnamed protein product [Phytophthora fragariaefolia]|uniref:Unnamed protein product n=1 Tax=Phytophthora fragariaefolia TaxID=1490495 RepID=A0A9W7CZ99_9STRA|nr:unnamed protein product [Phytophthora fragariaefolia]